MTEVEFRILKNGSCPSLSGRSTLTYNIGCMGGEIYLRIVGNTEKGIFNKDWIPLAQLDPLLASVEKPITSGLLKAMFNGKSANSAGFVMAVLLNEGLMKISKDNLRHYERVDPAEFMKGVPALMESEPDDTPQPKTEKKRKKESL
ncbi:MAG: hypothetical protein V1706_16775 [Pseudomonadota bacterium]